MASPIPQRVLVYDRIAQNRTKTVLLVTIAALSVLLLIAAIGVVAYEVTGFFFGGNSGFDFAYSISRTQEYVSKVIAASPEQLVKLQPEYERLEAQQQALAEKIKAGSLPPQAYLDELERLRAERERLALETERIIDPEGVKRWEEQQRRDRESRWEIAIVLTLGMAAVLAIFLWGLIKSPAAKALSFSGARPAGRDEAENDAARLLENLAIGAGLPPPKLYVIDSMALNAFAAGMDANDSTIAVTAGLLKLLDRRELEGVLAHELAHIGNRDTRLNTVVFAITLYLRLPALLWQGAKPEAEDYGVVARFSYFRFGRLLGLAPLYIYLLFVAPFLAMVIRAAISRRREALADADAALLTRYPEGLVRALAKMSGAGSIVTGSNPIVSHLYFSDPSAPGIGVGFFKGSLLASHPPIEERITRLQEFGAGVPDSVIREAVKAGEDFACEHPSTSALLASVNPPEDELTALSNAETRSRVFRLLGTAPVTLYQRDDPQSNIAAEVPPGTLLVSFEYNSKMRQVVTQSRTFGYLPRTAMLAAVKMTPEEAFQAAAQASVAAPPLPSIVIAAAAEAASTEAPATAPEAQPASAGVSPKPDSAGPASDNAPEPPAVPAQPQPDLPPLPEPKALLAPGTQPEMALLPEARATAEVPAPVAATEPRPESAVEALAVAGEAPPPAAQMTAEIPAPVAATEPRPEPAPAPPPAVEVQDAAGEAPPPAARATAEIPASVAAPEPPSESAPAPPHEVEAQAVPQVPVAAAVEALPSTGEEPGLSPVRTVIWALVAFLGVGAVLIGVLVGVRALLGH